MKRPRRTQIARAKASGFTLLEVMVAFAILALVTGFTTRAWTQNMHKAQRAVSRRELREVADSCFRRILYEIHAHEDGLIANVADFYARDWLKLEGRDAEKYEVYSLRLEKKVKSAAGQSEDGEAESLFGEEDTSGEEGSSSESEEGEGPAAIKLLEVTLHLYRTNESDEETLVTLKTYIRNPKEE